MMDSSFFFSDPFHLKLRHLASSLVQSQLSTRILHISILNSAPPSGRIKKVVEKAVTDAGTTPDKIFSCEIIGGATRIPVVQNALKEYFGKEVSY